MSDRNGRKSPSLQNRPNDHYSSTGAVPPPPPPSSSHPHEASISESRHYSQLSSHPSDYRSSYHSQTQLIPSQQVIPAYNQGMAAPPSSNVGPAAYPSQPQFNAPPPGQRETTYNSDGYQPTSEPPYSPKMKSNGGKLPYKDTYGLAINRALDISDLRRELDTVCSLIVNYMHEENRN